jgi:hypothetical protein
MPDVDVNKQVKRIWKAERDAVTAEARFGGCLPLVAAANMDIVSSYPTPLRREAPVTISKLSNRGEEVQIVSCPRFNHKTLWVSAEDRKYGSYYLEFISQCYGLALDRIPKPYNVDHMFNQKRALKYGYKYVRLALVSGPVNQSHGPGYEKTVTRGTRERGDTSRALMDEIGCMKFYGFMNPNVAKPRQSEIDAYARFASVEFGMSEAQVKESIGTLLQVAAFFKDKR